MSKYMVEDTELTSIADAIRGKTGETGGLSFPTEFVSEIGTLTPSFSTISETITESYYVTAHTYSTGSIQIEMEIPANELLPAKEDANDYNYVLIRSDTGASLKTSFSISATAKSVANALFVDKLVVSNKGYFTPQNSFYIRLQLNDPRIIPTL